MNAQQQLVDAAQALNAHDYSGALSLLLPFTVAEPNSSDGWQLIALAYKGLGQSGDAEQAFLKSIAILEQPHVLTNLGNLYRSIGRLNDAVGTYERALALQSDNVPCKINLARTLLDLKQLEIAEKHFSEVLQRVPEHINARIGLAQVLQLKGLQQEAVGLFQSALQSAPDNSAALNGLGISLKVLGYLDDATEVLLSAALASPEAPEIQSNLASALALSGREEEAVAAYERAIGLNPNNIEFHNWYNGYLGVIDHPDYLSSYRRVLHQTPGNAEFAATLARKLLLNDRGDEALGILASALVSPDDSATVLRELSYVRRELGHFDEALIAAREAASEVSKLGADRPDIQQELATALLASADDYDEAVELLSELVRAYPRDQGFLAMYSTALRYAGRFEEYHSLYDYERFVNTRYVTVPDGFNDRGGVSNKAAFLAYLRDKLESLHNTRRHPVDQSMVFGTQTLDDLLSRREPFIEQLRDALYEQLLTVVAALPDDSKHPFLSRKAQDIGFSDSWSVLLRQQGFHKNHFHSAGWLSSAFYLAVPDAVNAGQREGWIKFGEPGFNAREPLAPEHWVKPEEGALVVFPSYMWHGTVPLTTAKERMTVGYDVLPL